MLNLPAGKTIAVAIGADFDAQSLWKGSVNRTSPSYLSRGEFGAEVGVPRLLRLFKDFEIKATFCTPSHTMMTFPSRIFEILEAGHEIASHGCYHEYIPDLDPQAERELMEKQLQQYQQIVGGRPRGYRSPAWDFSENTLQLLEEFDFEWDSSLMGREFEPYHPRSVTTNWMEGNTFGEESRILEIPVSWQLDDWPALEYIAGISSGLGDHDVLYRRWRDIFDYGRTLDSPAVYALTLHPQCSGRSYMMTTLRRLLEHIRGFDDVIFCSLSDIFDYWSD